MSRKAVAATKRGAEQGEATWRGRGGVGVGGLASAGSRVCSRAEELKENRKRTLAL